MGILRSLERRSHPSGPDAYTSAFFGGRPSATGVVVTPDTALMASAVWRALSLLTKSIASIPLNVYTHLAGGGKALNTAHAVYDLLHTAPNDWQTSYEWREMMVGHLELRGNAYSEILAASNGKITALIPLHPDRVRAHYRAVVPGGAKVRFYEYTPLDAPSRILFWDEMLHWRGFSLDGVTGIGRIAMARETIGVSLAAEEHGARFFSNDATPGGVLSHPKSLSAEAAKHLKASWNARQQGASNAHAVTVLEEGMTWTSIGIANKDAQFLETRKFQVDEVARWFDIPPHKLMEMGASTFGNIEEQNIEFVADAVIPRTVNIAQACMRDLLSPSDRTRSCIEFVVDGLLRGNLKGQYEAYAIGKSGGFLSANDIRRKIGENPIPGTSGDQYLVPLNMVPADMLGRMADTASAASASAPDDPSARAAQVAELRRRVARAHHHIVADASLRALKKEVSAGRRALQAARAASSTAPLTAFADEFYREHEGFVARSVLPSVRTALGAFAELIVTERGEAPVGDDALDALSSRMAAECAKAHVARSRADLRSTLKSATPEQCASAVEACFSAWESTRAALDATAGLQSMTEAVLTLVSHPIVEHSHAA